MKDHNNENIIDFSDSKVKTDKTGRRMKIYIKLTKEETAQWNIIKDAVLGGNTTQDGRVLMSDGEFAKIMLFKGIEHFMNELTEAVKQLPEEEVDKILSEELTESPEEKKSKVEDSNENDKDSNK